ncbi:glycoside hydrolase family 2 TIM barrel-domain containing protein [Flavobacterium sp.]|uniref:glycoside hydrolase family 2 TIM barrel-domain containing protein n=1 Tax=Flavobacterium sp. TaxID=239 RepID=UPI0037536933
MKIRIIILTIIVLFTGIDSIVAQNTDQFQSETRSIQNFNFGWKYLKDNTADTHRVGLIDTDWEMVDLPHDAAIFEKVSQENSDGANGYFPYLKGSYRKHFTISSENQGKLIFVEFEGVYRNSKIWINGHYLGNHLNGYLGFEHELTDYILFDQDNLIVVKYDNTTKGTSRWYTGAGIYRDVWLKILDPLHVPLYGTYVTTPKVSKAYSLVNLATEVTNNYKQTKLCKLVSKIVDANNQVVQQRESVVPVQSEETFVFNQEIEVNKPHLWSSDNPYLYTLKSEIYDQNKLVDEYSTTFGIREIRMTPENGLLINGEKTIAVGGNIHHDLISLGAAAYKAGFEKHILDLKSMGTNSVRLSHNPHATRLLEVCDEQGILVFNEGFDKWTSQFYGGQMSFDSQYKKDVENWIKRDRNHPSVYIWSAGNEVAQQGQNEDEKFETPKDAEDYGVSTFLKIKEEINRWDPLRKVTVGLFPSREKAWNGYDPKHQAKFNEVLPAEMAWYSDVVSCNYTEQMFAKDHKKYPQMMFINSEANTSLGMDFKDVSWSYIDTNYVIAHYYWTGYAYLGEATWPRIGWSLAFFDLGGELTNLGSMYQSYYDKQPMSHLWVYDKSEAATKLYAEQYGFNKTWSWYPMTKNWNWENGTQLKMAAFSNCEEVELYLNGKSQGRKKPADFKNNITEWELNYQEGTTELKGFNKGKVVSKDELTTVGKPFTIQLKTTTGVLEGNGLDLAYVQVDVVDAKGRKVYNATNEITFEVSGAGTLEGLSSGDILSHENMKDSKRKVYNGSCQAVLKSGREKGTLLIKAKAEGLKEALLEIKVKQ